MRWVSLEPVKQSEVGQKDKNKSMLSGFPGGTISKESTRNKGDSGSIFESGRSPGGGHGNPLQYLCLENPHGQRSLVGYSLWGHRGSDGSERLTKTRTN